MIRLRKAKSAKAASGAKDKRTPKTVEEYEAGIPEAARAHFGKLRAT